MRIPAFAVIQHAARFVGELAWLASWSVVLGYWLDSRLGPAISLPLLAGFVLASALLAGVISRRGETSTRVGILVSSLGLLGAVGAGLLVAGIWPDRAGVELLVGSAAGGRAAVAAALALVGWWRGSRLGTTRPSVFEVEGGFRFGILAMAGLLGVAALIGPGATPTLASLVGPAFALVAAGLLGVPLARIAEVAAGPRSDSPQLAPTGPWLGTLLGIVGALLVLTVLVAGLLTADRLAAAIGLVLDGISWLIWAIMMVLAVPFGYLVEFLINLFRGALPDRPDDSPLFEPQPIQDILSDLPQSGQVPPEFRTLIDILLGLALAALIVMFLTRVLQRRGKWAREPDGVEEYRDTVFGWETIRELLAWLLGRLRRRPAPIAELAAGDSDPVEPASIREVYREFLRFAARLGLPRAQTETPIEFGRRLERVASAEKPQTEGGQPHELPSPPPESLEIETLTSSYLRARYGRPADARGDPGPAARALDRLRALWSRRG